MPAKQFVAFCFFGKINQQFLAYSPGYRAEATACSKSMFSQHIPLSIQVLQNLLSTEPQMMVIHVLYNYRLVNGIVSDMIVTLHFINNIHYHG